MEVVRIFTTADRIQELRKNSGDSQEQLADKLGVTRQAVSKWESGQGSPDIGNVVKLSEIYNVTTDYILTGIAKTTTEKAKPKSMDSSLKKALAVLLVFAGLAAIVIIFIITLYLFFRP